MPRAFLLLLLSLRTLAQDKDPAELLRAAVAEQQRGDYASAIRDYRHILSIRPDLVEAKIDLGAALSDTGQYAEAIALFQEGLLSVQDKKPVQMNLALAYFRKGDLARSREQLLTVHEQHPDDAHASRLLADVDLRTGRASEAIALLEPVEAQHLNDLDFQFAYGSALIAVGRLREGVVRVQKVAEIGNRSDAYFIAGSTLLQLNQPEVARQDLETALHLDPKLPGILALVGVAQDKTGDATSAEATLREALKSDPNQFQANLTLGAILCKRRELAEAKVYLELAMKLRPRDQVARYQWGMLKVAAGEYGTAAAVLEKVSREYPDWLPPHVALSTVYYKLHRPEDGQRERHAVDELTRNMQATDSSPSP